ncbi:uncharacterized protein CBL_10668 [Carabus blaptoides fortunei]
MTIQNDDNVRSTTGGAEQFVCWKGADSIASVDAMVDGVEVLQEATVRLGSHGGGNNLAHQQLLVTKGFPKRPPVNIQFTDITYTTWQLSIADCARVPKEILHGVSGLFKSGELSVIMGPSGAGKSTLLNILAGYTTIGTSGTVHINGRIRDNNKPHQFRRLSAYIQQEDMLRPKLTVRETMTIAAHLKLGFNVTTAYKREQVIRVLKMLGLEHTQTTMTGRLSGGQRKRLAIALELISNPPVLFLDEPTTGLDSSSCALTVSLLKTLAQEDGRTVVCTIHQPSALLFEMFDQLYAVAEGRCIYQGPVVDLLPFLSAVGLRCPPYHNPADFLMEISMGEYNADVTTLAEITSGLLTVKNDCYPEKKNDTDSQIDVLSGKMKNLTRYDDDEKEIIDPHPASQIMQFIILLQRNLLTFRRNYKQMLIRIFSHLALGLIFGYLYQDVGRGANTVLANYVYLYGTLLLVVYTGKMSVTLSFPLEMNILTREHFNRWYKLVPYLLAMVLVEIPFQILCTWLYIAVSYWLTAQPVDYMRLYYFVLFCTLSTLCAQSWGYFIGATTPVKIAVFIGPVIACLFSVFGFCIRKSDTPSLFRWMFHISYYRAGFQGIVNSVYGLNRTDLVCPDDHLYCHYTAPIKFLKEMEIGGIDLSENVSLIISIGCLMHLLTFGALWLKLNRR